MMMRASVTSLLVILSIFCSSTWAYHVRRERQCNERQVECPGTPGRCVYEYWLCDGDDDCGDGSDENQAFCNTNGAYQVRECMNALSQCVVPLSAAYEGLRPQQILEKLRNTDLRETCAPVLAAGECAGLILEGPACQVTDTEHPQAVEARKAIAASMTAAAFVCREHVQEFDANKECILRFGRDGPLLMESVGQQCRAELSSIRPPTFCPSPEAEACVEGVVTAQCGAEVAGLLRQLDESVKTDIGCTTQKFKRSKMIKMTKKEVDSPLKILEEALSTLF